MAYKTEELKAKAEAAITEHKLFFVHDVFTYLGIAKSTFYDHFPYESDDYKHIMSMLENNKTQLKVSMRNKWYKSDSAALQIALMKIISTPEERRLMSQSFVDVESGGEKIQNNQVDFSKLSLEALLELKKLYEGKEDSE